MSFFYDSGYIVLLFYSKGLVFFVLQMTDACLDGRGLVLYVKKGVINPLLDKGLVFYRNVRILYSCVVKGSSFVVGRLIHLLFPLTTVNYSTEKSAITSRFFPRVYSST